MHCPTAGPIIFEKWSQWRVQWLGKPQSDSTYHLWSGCALYTSAVKGRIQVTFTTWALRLQYSMARLPNTTSLRGDFSPFYRDLVIIESLSSPVWDCDCRAIHSHDKQRSISFCAKASHETRRSYAWNDWSTRTINVVLSLYLWTFCASWAACALSCWIDCMHETSADLFEHPLSLRLYVLTNV